MLKKIYLTIILSTLCGFAVMSQNTGVIKGKIVDKATGEPLPFASIVAELNGAQAGGAQTDFDGNFTIKPLAPGKYNIKATFVGYGSAQVDGVIVSADKITNQDIKLTKGSVDITAVEITEYAVPLIDPGSPSTQKTITSEEIVAAPTRDVKSLASTTAGVAQKDEGDDLNLRGARTEATDYYVDGIRVRGSVKLAQQGIEQITVITGGLPAQYGDNTGGLINITTKGASKEFSGGIGYETSELFDKYGYNLVSGNVSGPIWSQKDANGVKGRTLAGFFVAGEYQTEKDPDPSAIDLYKVKDDKFKEITENPLTQSPAGTGFVYSTDYLRASDLEKIKAKPNFDAKGYRVNGKINIYPLEKVEVTIGGNYDREDNHSANAGTVVTQGQLWNDMLMNSDNNAEVIETNWNAFARFTQRFGSGSSDKDKSASVIKNAYYSVQFDFSKIERNTRSDVHKDNLFDYGYIGKFTQTKKPFLQLDTLFDAQGNYLAAYQQKTFQDISYTFEGLDVNPIMQNYTEQYYQYAHNEVTNINELLLNNSLVNGATPSPTYSMWTSPGSPSGRYDLVDLPQFRASINGSADIKNHAIMVGFEFEQRVERSYIIVPIGLWGQMRLLANQFNTQLDSNAIIIGDTAFYPRAYNHSIVDANGNSTPAPPNFYENIRNKLGLSNTDYVDIDSYDRSIYSLDLFTADDLLNDGNSLINYWGYSYTGQKLSSKPTFEDFFKKKDENGNFTREIDAFRPIYMAGYIQDNFAINDLHFNVGVRVDRFDANQKVLKDDYLLYPAYTAGEQSIPNRPSNIGDDFVIYVNNVNTPAADGVVGYRDGTVWYDAKGDVVNDPKVLAQAAGGTIAPWLKNTDLVNNGTTNPDFQPNESFKDYDPQVSVMPRVAFNFPISDEALFYAHYDVLTERPSGRLRNSPISYLYLPVQGGTIFNPSLKPEKTTDYEIGFRQKVSNSSAISISSFYRELRNQINVTPVNYAYPVNYLTYGNVDFGTVKGLTFSYDLRRTGNLMLSASYTLQFADGTGSNDRTSNKLITNGLPNLRAIFPYDFDQRHNIVASVDYRYGSGKDYNGPVWFGTQFLQNTGINFIFKLNSGTPYSRVREVSNTSANIGLQQAFSGTLQGTVNGSRLPWQYKLDVKLDRDIYIKFGKNADKKKTATLNVYILAQNVLDAQNVISVYAYTGSPEDDGYIASAVGQSDTENKTDPTSFEELYGIKVNNPNNYSLPRRIRIGVNLNF